MKNLYFNAWKSQKIINFMLSGKMCEKLILLCMEKSKDHKF